MAINSINIQQNVIPNPPQPKRDKNPCSFKAKEESLDATEFQTKEKKSFWDRNRNVISFVSGALTGELLSEELVLKKLKNPSILKSFLITTPIMMLFAYGFEYISRKSDKNR